MTVKASDVNKSLCENNTVKNHHVNWSDFWKKTGFLDKIFSKKNYLYFQVYKDLKVIKARWTSLMTKKALNANVLLCDNNTVKIHHVNQSDFLKKTWLSWQDL